MLPQYLWDPRNLWWRQSGSDETYHTIFAPGAATEEIVEAFQEGKHILVIRVGVEDDAEQYVFNAYGFNEAAKPVFNSCNR